MSQAATAQNIPSGSALPVGVPGTSITPKFHVRVRFYRRMKVQRVYRMTVELRPERAGAMSSSSGDSIIARPVIPGAYVQPAEQELGPKASNNHIIFAVTPLARGRLIGARMQLVHQGRVLEEIRTPMRGTSQRWSAIFALLTLVGLGFLIGVVGPLPNLATSAVEKGATPPLENALNINLPDYNEYVPDGLQGYVSREAIAVHAQEGYDFVYDQPNLKFWIAAGFFVLMLLSLMWNRTKRGRRKGKPLMLPTLPAAPGGNPLAFATSGARR